MPVVDHEIHSMTQFNDTKRYGCHNRGAYAGAYMAHPWAATGGKWTEYRMSRECRYDRSLKDPWCADCKHRGSGEAYDAKVRELASVK
jgi:hypothetical protein